MKRKISRKVFSHKRCPFLKRPPSNDCYCVKLNSLSIEAAIYYCGNNYFECEIYKSSLQKKVVTQSAV
jgi:hypothetical protein